MSNVLFQGTCRLSIINRTYDMPVREFLQDLFKRSSLKFNYKTTFEILPDALVFQQLFLGRPPVQTKIKKVDIMSIRPDFVHGLRGRNEVLGFYRIEHSIPELGRIVVLAPRADPIAGDPIQILRNAGYPVKSAA